MDTTGIHIAHLTPEGALDALGSSREGLGPGEATRRRAEFGPNRVEEAARKPLWLTFLGEFSHFFAIILWLAAGLAFFAEHAQPGEGMGQLGIAIVGVILVNGCFSFWQGYQAEQALAARNLLLAVPFALLLLMAEGARKALVWAWIKPPEPRVD